ncbi:hypothetical protein CMV_027489 [Castanea mollissima]|uniref:Uncharacterized protein n=1 Tax=Castanea mollissima TaxID=60419 RepID=A0A8J4QI56_9ROSI|nr:hypothetical protein CMV_027489 [Castanea mollissima]
MATNASRWNNYWKEMPTLEPHGIIGIGVAVVLVFALIVIFFWWEKKIRTGPEEHNNAELSHDHEPHATMRELPQIDFHASEAATDCPVCLKEFVEGESFSSSELFLEPEKDADSAVIPVSQSQAMMQTDGLD